MAKIYISLGSNVEREHYVGAGLIALQQAFGDINVSSLFESEAIGFAGAAFYNLVVAVDTLLSFEDVATLLKKIEFAHGRSIKAKKYSPRTLDLDLLLYNNVIAQKPAQIPRDEILTNAFVLWPLSELAGELAHPVNKKTYRQLWQEYDQSSQKLRKVPLNWPQ